MEVSCNKCDHTAIAEASNGYACPHCGNTEGFALSVEVTDTVGAHDSVRLKVKTDGDKKPYLKAWEGKDIHAETGEVREVSQVVDRRNGRYQKRVTGPSGEVIKDENKPLSEKDGGSAQRRYKPPRLRRRQSR
jgi:hypothetical protein